MSEQYAALDPCSDAAPIDLVPLAARLSNLDGVRVTLLQTMPPGSGLEAVIDVLQQEISKRAPTASIRHVLRRNFMMTDFDEIDDVASTSDAVVVVSGPAATMVHLAVVFATELERRGVPTSLVHFDALRLSAEHSLTTVGAPVRVSAVGPSPHLVDRALDDLVRPLTTNEQSSGVREPPARARIAVTGSLAAVNDEFAARGWTDGLPIVPPTEAEVARMLTGTSRRPEDVVTESLRPEGRRVTVEMVAINAVMAGARPEYLPVILAAATVFGDLQFESMTRSVNSFAFAELVSGPIADEIGMNGALGGLGPGTPANATIGRAINLLLRTAGGSKAGVNSTPTQGSALGYTTAYTEFVDGSPWEPFHVGLGFEEQQSTVSILLGGWAHNGNFYYGDLDDVARALQSFEIPQTGAFVFVSEKRAHQLAADGWTKEAIETYLHEKATIRLGNFRASGFWAMSSAQIAGTGPSTAPVWPADYLTRPDDDVVPGYPPGTIKVVVIGNDVSSLVQAWKWQLHRTVVVDDWR